MASYPAVIELRVDGITQVTRVLDSIQKLDQALVNIKKTPLAIDAKNAIDGIRVLKEEVDRFVIKLGEGKAQLASTTAGLNAQAAAFRNLAANVKIGEQSFRLYTQAAEQARQKGTLTGGLAEVKALRDAYVVGRTAPNQAFKGVEDLIKFGSQIPKNTASLNLYRGELERVLTLVDYGTKEYFELEKAIAAVNKQLQVGQGLGPVQGPAAAGVGGRAAARGRQAGGSSRFAGAVSNAVIGASFPLLFGQSGGAAVGGAVGGLAGSLLGPGGGFAGSLLGTLLGEVASKGQQVKELATDIGFTAEQTKRLQEAFALAGRDSDKFIESVQNIRGLSLSLEDQADAVQLVSRLTENYGGKIDKVTNAFTSALESGKVTQATLNQLTSQGIPIQDALAKKYGVSRDKILQMAKDGQISVQDLIDTLVKLGNQGVTSTEKTKSGFDQLIDSVSKLGGSLASLGASIVGIFAGPFDWLLKQIANIINASAQGIASLRDLLNFGTPSAQKAKAAIQSGRLPSFTDIGGVEEVLGTKRFRELQKQASTGIFGTIDTNKLLKLLQQQPEFQTSAQKPIDRITVPSQLPPSGGSSNGGRTRRDTAAEEAARLQATLDQLTEQLRIENKLYDLEVSAAAARADGNLELLASIESDKRLLDIQEKRSKIQKDFDSGKIGNAEKTLRLQLLGIETQKDQLLYEEDLNSLLKERYGITEAIIREARKFRELAFGTDAALGTFRTDINLMPGLTGGAVGEELQRLGDELKLLTDPANQLINAANGIGDAFANSFKGIISGSMSAKEALANFFQSVADYFLDMAAQIIQKWIQMTILNSILRLFPGGSSIFGSSGAPNFSGAFGASGPTFNPGIAFGGGSLAANGAVFSNNIAKFARGGIVNSPMLFPFANGGTTRMGLMGEAGPEAIMPLRRGADGRLGVEATGGGGSLNVVVNVDAKGTSVQGNDQTGNQLGRVIAAAVQQELIKQKRPGGLLT